jgi:hypothetical protein
MNDMEGLDDTGSGGVEGAVVRAVVDGAIAGVVDGVMAGTVVEGAIGGPVVNGAVPGIDGVDGTLLGLGLAMKGLTSIDGMT